MNSKPNLVNKTTLTFLVILSISELIVLYSGSDIAASVGRAAFILLWIAMVPNFSVREWALSLIAGALAVGLLTRDDGLEALLFSLNRAAFFAAFIYLVTLLKEAAQRSASVLDLGHFLTVQPPGRRYYSLAIGGHLMGVLLNFGAVSLLTPLIQRGASRTAERAGQGAGFAKVLERQQISALLRGFAWMIMWSPTALTQAVLLTAFPNAHVMIVIALGIGASAIMILIGRIEGRIRGPNPHPITTFQMPMFPKRSAINFAVICGLLIGLTSIVVVLADVSAAVALMLAAPLVTGAWLLHQNSDGWSLSSIQRTKNNISALLIGSVASQARSAFTLGAAGFIGESAAKLAPVNQVADYLERANMPPWLFLMMLPIIINVCGQVALSPILVVVFLSAVINALPLLPADPNLIVFALGAGWALSMTASPNASATLLISGISNIAPTKLTWQWNGFYAAICFLVFTILFYILSKILTN